MDLADQGQRPLHQLHQLPLAHLGAVEVELKPQVRTADGSTNAIVSGG